MSNKKFLENGVTLIEALMAITLVSIVLLAHIQAIISNTQTYNRTRRNSLAMQQAVELMEQYSSKNLDALDSSYDLSEASFLYNGIRFERTVSVTANADPSVRIEVSVASVATGLSGNVTLTKDIALLDKR